VPCRSGVRCRYVVGLLCSKANAPEQLNPGDDRGTPDHRVERLEGLLLAEPLAPLDQEFQVGLDRRKIDVLGITSWHQLVIIVWHVGSRQSCGNGVSAKLPGVSQLRREAWRPECQMMVDDRLP